MFTRNSSFNCAIAGLSLMAASALADPLDGKFTFQGQVKQSGVPVTGMADFQIRLYDTEVGGMPIDTNGFALVEVFNGLFAVELDFGVEIFDGQKRWIEIDVEFPSGAGNWTTLSPRQAITGVPYALQSRGLFVDNAGRVGIGTVNPAARLDVVGDVRVDDDVVVFGDVRANGDYTFATDRTFYLNIPACGFQRVDPLADDRFVIVSTHGYIAAGTPPYGAGLNAAVCLPEGATVRSVTAYFYDGEDPGDLDITLTLISRAVDSTGGYSMARVEASTTGTSLDMQNGVDDSVSAALIDNTTNMYELALYFEQDVLSTKLRFYGCRIEYTVTQLNP